MVCQAASQTRFRALKHENGIAGSATIIVRVIACFQPLQDCQVNCCGLMEKDLGSWFQHQHIDWRFPNLNSSCAPFKLGQSTVPSYMNPWNNDVSTNGNQPVFAFSGLPYNNASQSNEPRGWFYCLPRYRQAFDPILNSVPKEKPTSPNENCIGDTKTNAVPVPQKRFLVFDQSGDRTTLIFSSGLEAPVQYLPSWSPKMGNAFDSNKEDPATKRERNHLSTPVLNDDVQSEMREDSEELDALLHCDDDDSDYEDYDDDDEVTSTGHSPSSLTDYDDQERSDESGEEVASSSGPTKRLKLVSGGYEVPSLGGTTSSVKVNRRLEYEDDAESSCGESKNQVFGESGSSTGENLGFVETGSLIGSKRSRKERIRTSVSILQSIIPGGMGKDKDAIVVLDEAINYLKSLKVKAEALGFDTL